MIALCATKVRTWTSGRKFAFPSVSPCSIRAEPWQFLVWFLTHRAKFIFVWCCSQTHTKLTFETISRAKSEVSKNCKRIKPLSSGSISAAWFRNFWKRRIFVYTQIMHKHHNAHNYIDKTILQGYINLMHSYTINTAGALTSACSQSLCIRHAWPLRNHALVHFPSVSNTCNISI